MNFKVYSLMTIIGSALWCTILAWFGAKILGDQPQLLENPDLMIHVLKDRAFWFVGIILLLAFLYFLAMKLTAEPSKAKS